MLLSTPVEFGLCNLACLGLVLNILAYSTHLVPILTQQEWYWGHQTCGDGGDSQRPM